MTKTKNLWPEFQAEPKLRTVRRVLLEAAEGLPERTNKQIQLVVDSMPGKKGRFVHDCSLWVPRIGYKYPLFKVTENGDPYPVTVVGDGTFEKGTPAGDENALVENLRLLFHSDATKRTIQQLLDILS